MAYRIFVSAGEASGDRHAAALIRALRKRVGEVEVRGLGGAAMEAEGADLLARVEDLSVLGFAEVAKRLPYFLKLERRAKQAIRDWNPHLVLPVDYPGFNLRLARAVRRDGFRVIYYVAPQVWAWRRERRPGIARAVDRLLVVFPFEKALFEEAGISTTFVGHPLLDAKPILSPEAVRDQLGIARDTRLLALLPGSRSQEVSRILPPLVAGAAPLIADGVRVVVSRAAGLSDALFARVGGDAITVWDGAAADLTRAADAALVASGTATLETGLQGTPLGVVYRTGKLNGWLAQALLRIRTVGLVNIAAGGSRVPELLQSHLQPAEVEALARRLLFDEDERADQKAYLATLRDRLGREGSAERAAAVLADELLRVKAGR